MKLSEQLQRDHGSGDLGKTLEGYVERVEQMETALERIEKWFGEFPPSGHYWDEERKREMSYGAAFGSDGERDYMRSIAKKALRGGDI